MAAPPQIYRFPHARTPGSRFSGQAVSPHRYIQRREQTVDEYFSIYEAAEHRRLAEEMAQIEEEIRAERRERARIRARERRARQRAEKATGQAMITKKRGNTT